MKLLAFAKRSSPRANEGSGSTHRRVVDMTIDISEISVVAEGELRTTYDVKLPDEDASGHVQSDERQAAAETDIGAKTEGPGGSGNAEREQGN